MSQKAESPMPLAQETLELIELHRELTSLNGITVAQPDDAYSLAQPSPYRFVPTVASNGAATAIEGV